MPKRLLFVGANPSRTENGKVRQEAEEIASALPKASRFLKMAPPLLTARDSELRDALEKNSPHILHIACHGTDDGQMVLYDHNDDAKPFDAGTLGDILSVADVRPDLIVINACRSESFAKELLEYSDCVIGTTDDVPSDWAVQFSKTFYRYVSKEGLPSAFNKALIDVRTHCNVSEEEYAHLNGLYRVYSNRVLTTDAYVIQPLADKSAVERAENIFTEFIAPACRKMKFNPRRSDELQNGRSNDPILNSLRCSRLVLADLGREPYDPHVMAEVGFRLANGRPIVFLADADAALPPLVDSKRTFRTNRPYEELVRLCKAALRSPEAWDSNYPTVEISIDHQVEEAEYVFANDAAAKLYDVRSRHELIGKPVKDVDERVYEFMPDDHRQAFIAEQNELIWKCLSPNASADVRARVPMWFTNHPKANCNGYYWPILSQKSHTALGATNVLRIVFVPVTDWMPLDVDIRPVEPKRLPADFLRFELLTTDVLSVHCPEDNDWDALRLAVTAILGGGDLRTKAFLLGRQRDGLVPLALRSKLILVCLTAHTASSALQDALLEVMKRNPGKPVVIVHSQNVTEPMKAFDRELRDALSFSEHIHCPVVAVPPTWYSDAEKPWRDGLTSLLYCMKTMLRQECPVRLS